MSSKISRHILLLTPWTQNFSSTALFAVIPNRRRNICGPLKWVIWRFSPDLLPFQHLLVYSEGFWGLVAIQMSCEKHGEVCQCLVTKSCGQWFFHHNIASRNWWASTGSWWVLLICLTVSTCWIIIMTYLLRGFLPTWRLSRNCLVYDFWLTQTALIWSPGCFELSH